jgi:glucosamine 6-phosphate synthetase-like amidotransferase/phosphosugar isomerase protein
MIPRVSCSSRTGRLQLVHAVSNLDHLVERVYVGSLCDAVIAVFRRAEGHFTYCALAADEPDMVVTMHKEAPLVAGLGRGENFVVSAVPAFLSETCTVILPNDGEVVADRHGVNLFTLGGEPQVIAVASEDNEAIGDVADHVFYALRCAKALSPLLAVVPLQLCAYYIAKHRGEKVDRPRNLAKTVTVE